MLEVINLSFDYQEQPLLNNVNFNLLSGGLLHLRGANGAGKTTLLKLIAGLYYPTQGKIYYSGSAVDDDLAAYQKELCFVGHKTGINLNLTLRENCFFDLHSTVATLHSSDIEQLAYTFRLTPYLDSPCGLLSAGQRRQVGLLRLWMSKAKLWLLDEPFVALDDQALEQVTQKIAEHRAQGGMVLLTSHQQLSAKYLDYQEYYL